jgi:PKD repeat protein
MKRIIAILPLLSLLVISCHREPFADATVDQNTPYVGEYVRFESLSTDYEYIEWDMDDGITYSTPVVDHYYIDPGAYNVTLRAFGKKGGVSTAVIPMTVLGSEVKIIVRDYEFDDLIPNVEIYLFQTLADWDTGDINLAIGPFYTDSYGEVKIDGLSYQKYYVDAYYQNGNTGYVNWLLGADDVNWIETMLLTGWEYHTFIAYVDYVTFNAKKSAPALEEPRKGRIPVSPADGQKKATGHRPLKENKSSQKRENR